MARVPAVVPAEHTSDHVLVVPRPPGGDAPEGHPLPGLAAAWFDDVGWLSPPSAAAPSRAGGGARFHGVRAVTRPAAGVLRLGDEHRATGPFPLDAAAAAALGCAHPADAWALGRADGALDARGGRPAAYDDRDGIARAFAAALPVGEELRLVRWAVAVARRTSGMLLADGRQVLRPDPAASVDLVVWPARPVPAGELLEVVRSVVATSTLEAAPGGEAGHRVLARTPYDGDLVVTHERAGGPPRALAAEPWPDGAPATVHRLAWLPQDPYELQVSDPSGLHVIARDRARALLARVASLLHGRAGGAVVDDAGFVLTARDLESRRADPSPGARAWV
ncbi:hypothetical protein [Krasilnikoviella flava]|uniref:Uncharacterized protein n=1 Tax=Krasilnikoviella flava TaxID=526729 RepID=A0A1T5LJZ9_9MICO|nr:hypothetical protein [Krasilnikoviella flava]SKC76317.1 hypothetical protein SAMN04324258_3574 [Krasilnikoviella flava]